MLGYLLFVQQYETLAKENKLKYLREMQKWAEDNQIQFSKRISILVKRFCAKHGNAKAKQLETKPNADEQE